MATPHHTFQGVPCTVLQPHQGIEPAAPLHLVYRMLAKVIERFRLQAVWGDPTGRHTFLVVEHETPAKIAELMNVLTWFN